MINRIQNKNTSQTAFTAHISNTLGKKACDKLAKKLLESNDKASVTFAKDYFTSLEKIKKEKNIKEVIIRTTDSTQAPDVWCDGLSVWDLGIGVSLPKSITYEEKETYHLMRYIKRIANNLSATVNKICDLG